MRRPSGLTEMPRRMMSSGDFPRSCSVLGPLPSRAAGVNSTSPFVSFTRPEMERMTLLFPAPFAPMSVTIRPCGMRMLTPCTAWMPP